MNFRGLRGCPTCWLEAGGLNEILAQAAALYEDREVKINLNLAENLPNALIDEEQLKRRFYQPDRKRRRIV